MDSSWFSRGRIVVCGGETTNQEEADMDPTTIAVDLAKDIFEVAEANQAHRVVERRRLTRAQFERYLRTVKPGTEVVMEACGTAHYWGRVCRQAHLQPILLPVQYVRAYVRRNKSDRTDTEALLEARRCDAMLPVPIKSPAQQALQALHRIRQQWQTTRTARINVIRGVLREHGVTLRVGARTIHRDVPRVLEDDQLPGLLRWGVAPVLEEIRILEHRVAELDAQLTTLVEQDEAGQRLRTIPGVGVITATALLASVPHIQSFRRGREFASWLGLTPRERASGHRRWQGRISKRGDVYLRTLLIHGARSVIHNARRLSRERRYRLTPLHRWAVELADRVGANKAATGLANKLARVIWAVWCSEGEFVARPAA